MSERNKRLRRDTKRKHFAKARDLEKLRERREEGKKKKEWTSKKGREKRNRELAGEI